MRLRIVLFVVFVAFLAGAPATAQGLTFLNYGDSTSATFSAQNPVNVFAFSGVTDDLVTVRVVGAASGQSPTVTLLGPNQQVVTGVPVTGPPSQPVVTVVYTLPLDGLYTMIVTAPPGDFVVALDGPSAGAQALTAPGSTNVTLTGEGEQVVNITNSSAGPMALSVTTADTTAFSLLVEATGGQTLIQFAGTTSGVCVVIPGGSGDLTATLAGGSGGAPVDLSVTVAPGLCDGTIPESEATPEPSATSALIPTLTRPAPPAPPAATEEAAAAPALPACTVLTSGSTNIRSGPGTQYPPITSVQAGVALPLVGISDDGWGVVEIAAIEGFVSLAVVTTQGDCANLPYVFAPVQSGQAPATPTATQTPAQAQPPAAATATPTPSPTATVQQPTAQPDQEAPDGNPLEPLATATPSFTPTASATFTPTFTPTTPPPTAPPDGNYALQIPLDSTSSATDFVSFPNGDTQDRVNYSVSGMNANAALTGGRARLVLSVSCFGTGTQNITFFSGGQTFSCGQTVVDREVTFDSNTGSVLIEAVGGDATFVQWVLTGTATRLN